MAISQHKQDELRARLEKLGVREGDVVEKFVLGTGPGGQKVNKTASCVYLKHLPTGIEVKCGQERSQELNRFFARRKLCELLEKELLGIKTPKEKEIEKIQKQKQRRARKSKTKLAENSKDIL